MKQTSKESYCACLGDNSSSERAIRRVELEDCGKVGISAFVSLRCAGTQGHTGVAQEEIRRKREIPVKAIHR
jgi:hypothetical protein